MQVKDSIRSVIELTKCFRTHDIHAFQATLRGPSQQIVASDTFFSDIVGDLVHKLRKESIHSILYPKLHSTGLNTMQPESDSRRSAAFSRVHLSFFARRLDISVAEVERLVILILLEDQSLPVHERSVRDMCFPHCIFVTLCPGTRQVGPKRTSVGSAGGAVGRRQ
jgi:hypothetical protein